MIGETLGSYRVVAKIGEGGMGVVYLAEHQVLGKRAAVKLLLASLSQNKDMVARFFTEARAAALLRNPAIVDIYDFGWHSSGCAYLAMEYLEGESLASLLRRQRPLPTEALSVVSRQVAFALAAAHQKGIVHRDLKPDNVMLVPDPAVPLGLRVKVLDFGIAKLAADGGASSMTRTGTIMGTPSYMSPEQCRGSSSIDWRADIYSLGCMLYEMACGRPPFEGEGVGDILGKHQYVAPVPPRAVNPALPAQLEALILHSLAKRPEDRPQSMAEMARALEQLWPIASDGHGFAIGEPQASTTLGTSSGRALSVRAQKRRTGLIVGGVVAVLLAGTGALLARRGGNDGVPEIPAKEATAPPPEPPPPGSTKLEDARRALSENRWTNAVALADEALAADPGNSEAKAVRDRADREAQAATAYEQLLAAVAKKDLAAIDTLYETIPTGSVYRERAGPSRARARQEWAAGERSKIEVYVRKGACAEAKRMAAAVAERVPEIEAELDTLTRGCSARPKRKEEPLPAPVALPAAVPPPTPTPTPTPTPDFEQLVAKARDASKNADFGVALAMAEDALRLRPDDAEAATLAALAACHLKNATKAQAYMSKMVGSRRSLVRQACQSEYIALDGPDAVAATAGEAELPETLAKSDIDAGMRSVADDVRRCKSGYGPSGTFTVELTAGADGTVTAASVSPLFAGTPTGACVEKAVRAARFKRAKNPTTFNYPYTFFR